MKFVSSMVRYVTTAKFVLTVLRIDIIIVEDDPYYFLQEGPYVPKWKRMARTDRSTKDEEAAYVASLAPSFLKYVPMHLFLTESYSCLSIRVDHQGRVVRLDTFSKVFVSQPHNETLFRCVNGSDHCSRLSNGLDHL